MQGVAAHHDLRGLAVGSVRLRYRGQFVPSGMSEMEIECEVYEADGIQSVHSVCPKCRRAQWIDGRNKDVSFDATAGTLRVEPFTCSWEMGGADDRHRFGFGLCRARLAYDRRTARDAGALS